MLSQCIMCFIIYILVLSLEDKIGNFVVSPIVL